MTFILGHAVTDLLEIIGSRSHYLFMMANTRWSYFSLLHFGKTSFHRIDNPGSFSRQVSISNLKNKIGHSL